MVVAMAFGLVGCGLQVPPSAPGDHSAGPSQGVLASPAVAAARWEAVGPALGRCVAHAAIVLSTGELVAICEDVFLKPRLLVTSDGSDWQPRELTGFATGDMSPLATSDPPHVPLLDAMAEAPGGSLVIVGADALDDISSGDAATWLSHNGISWTRSAQSPTLHDAEMRAVIATSTGFMAVGADGFPGGNVQLPGLHGPAVWRSADGAAWEHLSLARGQTPMLIEGIAAIADGWVAWGGAARPGSAAAWTSTDGQVWVMSANPPGDPWGPIGRIVEAPDGSIIAVGSIWPDGHDDASPGIWRSTDSGAHWRLVETAARTGPGALWDVVSTGARLFAAGAGGRLLESADGVEWNGDPVDPSDAAMTIRQLVPLGDVLIGFGTVESEDGTTGGIWRRAIPH
jgi:hypothetical protein